MVKKKFLVAVTLMLAAAGGHAEEWTLQQCIDYALENNIQIQQNRISEEEGEVSLWQTKGQLFPSLSFSTSHSVGYRPFEESTAIVQNGQVTTSSNKWTYSGSYGLNASVTLWNGGINQKNIESQKLQNEITSLTTETNELTIQEQIAQLYVQILYSQEAVKVNEELEKTAKSQYERAVQMKEQGQMSTADVAQLEAQWRSTQYDIVSGLTTVADYKRQLKSVLQLPMDQSFDISGTAPTYEQVMAAIPTKEATLESAISQRPEIKSAELQIQAADLELDIAKRGYYPTISASASVGDSHYSASDDSYGSQLKTNLNFSAGVTVSVPIFDNRQNRSNVKKARLSQQTARLDLQDKKTTLSSTIEELWLNANNNQQRYVSARAKTESQQVSYNLLNEQFQNGLKNIVEVLQGRDELLSAKQDELQSKYTALLNMQLLKFYTGEKLTL